MKSRLRINRSSEIAEILRSEILASEVTADTPAPSTGVVARRFGVAAMTADKAIRNLVDAGIVYRVKGSGTFVRPRPKRQLHIGFVDVVNGQFQCESINQANSTYLDYVFSYFRGLDIAVHLLRLAEVQDATFLRDFARQLDGFLVSLDFNDSCTMGNLKATGLPVVVYRGNTTVTLPFSQISYDYSGSIAAMFAALAITPDDPPILICEDNINGRALGTMVQHHADRVGFAARPLEVELLSFQKRAIECYKLVRVHRKRLTGRLIVSLADALTLDLLNAFAEENMEPGRDFRLVSVGNCEAYGVRLFDTPRLSAIDVPREKMAHEGCRLLLELIRHPSDAQHIVKVPTEFIERASTARPVPSPYLQTLHLERKLP